MKTKLNKGRRILTLLHSTPLHTRAFSSIVFYNEKPYLRLQEAKNLYFLNIRSWFRGHIQCNSYLEELKMERESIKWLPVLLIPRHTITGSLVFPSTTNTNKKLASSMMLHLVFTKWGHSTSTAEPKLKMIR